MKNKINAKENKKQRLALTLIFSLVTFIVLSVTMVVVAGGLYILLKLGFLDPVIDIDKSQEIIILIMALSSVLLGTGLSVAAVNIPLQPFKLLIEGLNKLASGDFTARLKIKKPMKKMETINILEESFNTLASELENTEMLRSDFINNFSHEFKTPIVSIAGFAKLLKQDSVSEDQKKEYINIIEEESLRLSYLATNVLDLTKIENQTILRDVTEFNISEQIRTCVLMFEDKWTKKNLDIRIDIDEYYVKGNEELLKQVWLNLLDNAVKFANTNGWVHVEIVKNQKTHITITNSGSTIKEENFKRVFNKFYQEEKSHSTQGNGIGLAIVKKIVALHDGEIKVQTEKKQTSFTVII